MAARRDSLPHRRSLSQVRGRPRESGEPRTAALLSAAWRAAHGDDGRTLTHGFHAWPARAHPAVVGALIDGLTEPGAVVLDPFAGSGTVVVEALARRRIGVGFDSHPIAARIARARSLRLEAPDRRKLEQNAAAIARRARRGDAPDIEEVDDAAEWFSEPVWRELCALAYGLHEEPHPTRRFLLQQVLSSILVKVSRRAAETDARRTRGAQRGTASRLFVERTTELCKGMAALRYAAHETPAPCVAMGDARALPLASKSVDLVVTSPPYLGTYDYAEMQGLRARLLGLDIERAADRELGTRRRAADAPAAEERRYRDDLGRALSELRRVHRPDAMTVVLIGDSTVRGRMIDAARLTADVGRRAGLKVVAASSQPRPATVRGAAREGRFEHLIALAPTRRGQRP